MNGALDFLDDRPNVEPGRIGGLGLSAGANVLIEVAGENRRLSADGATGRSLADVPPDSLDVRLQLAPVLFSVALFSGERPRPPLPSLVPRLSPTPCCSWLPGRCPLRSR